MNFKVGMWCIAISRVLFGSKSCTLETFIKDEPFEYSYFAKNSTKRWGKRYFQFSQKIVINSSILKKKSDKWLKGKKEGGLCPYLGVKDDRVGLCIAFDLLIYVS